MVTSASQDDPSPSIPVISSQESSLAPPKLTTDKPVTLRVVDQKAYLWDVEDIKRLRVDHHICGVLIGTLPQVAQQNVFLGLPLQLLPEEVAVLLTHGLAVLVDDTAAHLPPTEEQAANYANARLQAIQKQQETILAQEMEKEKRMKERYSEQIEKKRREKAEKRRLQGVETGSTTEEVFNSDEPASAATQRKQSDNEVTPERIAKTPYSITTFTSSSSSKATPWYDPSFTISTLSSARETISPSAHKPIFPFPDPSSSLQISRFRVFQDLWKRGYYMGKGLKFGGDYLVYPGDPLRFHSHFSTTVLPSPREEMDPLDLVSWGRLATAVKKACLLATWNEEKGRVDYISLEWAGFG